MGFLCKTCWHISSSEARKEGSLEITTVPLQSQNYSQKKTLNILNILLFSRIWRWWRFWPGSSRRMWQDLRSSSFQHSSGKVLTFLKIQSLIQFWNITLPYNLFGKKFSNGRTWEKEIIYREKFLKFLINKIWNSHYFDNYVIVIKTRYINKSHFFLYSF